jgi:hypothetical protein
MTYDDWKTESPEDERERLNRRNASATDTRFQLWNLSEGQSLRPNPSGNQSRLKAKGRCSWKLGIRQ